MAKLSAANHDRRLQSTAEQAYRRVKVSAKSFEFRVCFRREFSMVTVNVNGARREVQAPDDTPLLYVLRNDLQLIGPQFGCGLAQCGACAVLVDGKEVRSCVTPVASIANQEITTLEGLPARWAEQKGLS